jgi:hypothetical protein
MFATMSSQVAALTLAGDVGLDIGFLNHPIASKRRSNVHVESFHIKKKRKETDALQNRSTFPFSLVYLNPTNTGRTQR